MIGMPERCVLIQRNFRVKRDDLAVTGLDQRVDLDQCGVLGGVDLAQQFQNSGDLRRIVAGEAGRQNDLICLNRINAGIRVDGHSGQRIGPLHGKGFYVHASLPRAHGQIPAVGPVKQQGEVVLLCDVGSLGDHHLFDDVALDV